MKSLYLISFVIFLIGIVLLFLVWYFENKKKLNLKPKKRCNFAILIPARDESKVITNLLESIKPQVKDFSNTYIIVEDKKDPTCNIAKNYKANIIVRKDLEGKRRKGYALDEAIKQILKKKKYDLYFIFDADNILDKNFISNMLESYKKGYEIVTGYRNIKNPVNQVSICSGLVFSLINTIMNKNSVKLNNNIIISGTGYFISGNIINKLQGFPFHSLTEDYELTLYATANNIPTYYNEEAIFFDEQPTDMKTSIKQRTRWVKGFLEARLIRLSDIKDDYGKMIGIIPYLFLIIGAFSFIIANVLEVIYLSIIRNPYYLEKLYIIFITLVMIYLLLMVFTIVLVIKEKNKLNISRKDRILAILFNPIFLATFIISFVKTFGNKNLGWEKIEHKDTEIIKKVS